MNCCELKRRLEELNVPKYDYSILGQKYPNEAFCLVYEDSLWKYYYSERGHRTGLKEFESESEACEYFYKQIMEIK